MDTYTFDFPFAVLREANTARLPQFKNRRGEPAHDRPDGSDWPPTSWCNAVWGEFGEAANVLKKMERGDFASPEEGRAALGAELGDVLTYLDLLASQVGVKLQGQRVSVARVAAWRLPRLMNDAGRRLGILGAHVEVAEDHGRYAGATFHRDGAAAFDAFAARLGYIAARAEIDLAAATFNKFNVVSLRVGASVTILSCGDRWTVGH